jgi:hypothetical protein
MTSVLGRPLSYYPMKAAMECDGVDKVYLSTDDEALMELAAELGAEIIKRPPELCTNEALGEDAYLHGCEEIKKRNPDKEMEQMLLLFCNAATLVPSLIDEGIEALRKNPDYDSAVTVSSYNMWSPLRARKEGEDGLLHPFVPFETFGDPKTLNCDRDSQGEVWFADMSLSVIRPRNLDNLAGGLLPQKWMGQKIYPVKQWGGCDVDYKWQIPGVEYWLREHGFTETKTPYDK